MNDPDPPTLDELVARGDLDGLIRAVDRAVDADDWPLVDRIRHRSRAAIDRGFQLWPATTWAEYRLALGAPGEWAATTVSEGAGWLGPGPLTEVVASTHTWRELAPHLEPGPLAAVVAQERVLRGEDLSGDPDVPRRFVDLPLRLEPWEPAYTLAAYGLDGVTVDTTSVDRLAGSLRPVTGTVRRPADPADEARGLESLVDHWAAGSGGMRRAVEVEGTAPDAIATVSGHGSFRATTVSFADALAVMADSASSGGAHGRRRGAAAGRQSAWWCAAVLCGLDESWGDLGSDELADAAGELRWFLWAPATGSPPGWSCRIAVEDRVDGLAWALDATDSVGE